MANNKTLQDEVQMRSKIFNIFFFYESFNNSMYFLVVFFVLIIPFYTFTFKKNSLYLNLKAPISVNRCPFLCPWTPPLPNIYVGGLRISWGDEVLEFIKFYFT